MGKMIGGSSALNYMYYIRGNKSDYENWVDLGNDGWDWNTVTNYFKKSERLNVDAITKSESAILHDTTGNLGVTIQPSNSNNDDFLKAIKEMGHDVHIDTNGFQQMGYSAAQFTINNGERQSSASAFIKPIKDRPNLFIQKKTTCRKILIDGKRAIGVEIQNPTGIVKVMAKREVILSAGAINSPQLLMLSGVGPKEHLEEMQINTVLDSPNVGENLQDHVIVPVMFTALESKTSVIKNLQLLKNLDTFPMPSIVGFAALDKSQSYPDYQATVVTSPAASLLPTVSLSQVLKLDDSICMAVSRSIKYKESVSALITLLHPKSRGKVKLSSSDPLDKAIIQTNYFKNKDDLTKLALSVKDYLSVVDSSVYRKLGSKIVDFEVSQCADLTFGSHEYWKRYVLTTASTQFHPVGTCAMGPKEQGVVDARLRVHGLTGLRVVDASVMPTTTSGNTNAPVIMIAEKASDMIKADNGIVEMDCVPAKY